MTYFFTYGADHRPFNSGWTEVEADDFDKAVAAYNLYHPPTPDGLVNCAAIYSVDAFGKTFMFEKGNFGKRCVERIRLSRV